jgi:hypothetical protein
MSGQFHALAALPPVERALGTHYIGVWMDQRTGLDNVERRKFLTLPVLELRPVGRPARSQSVYRLRYPKGYLEMCLKDFITFYLYFLK